MGAKEQKYLIDNNFHDLCLNKVKVSDHGDKRGYLYVSDVMEMYNKSSNVVQQQISGSTDATPILKTCENCHEYQAGCENYSGKVCERWVESF